MRRVGLVLAGLGACLIVFAILVTTWVTGQVIKFPLNQYATVTLTDPDATYFSAAKLTEMTGVNMEATYTIKGNAAAGSSGTAVWNQFVYVYDQTNKQAVQSITRTFAFNRRTAQLVNCCGANVNGNTSVQQTGYVGYVLPIGTKKQTYDVFDTNLNKAVPFVYSGIGDVEGTQAYKFTETVAPTKNGTQTVPGSLVNQSASSVTLPQYYQVQTTYWIDPVTGALLNVTQNEKLTLRNTDGSQALVLFKANLVANQASIDGLIALDNSQVSKASLVGTLLPLATGIIGLLLLIIGIVLFRRPEADAEAAPSRHEPELDAAGPEARSRSLVPGLDDEREATVESPAVREAAVNEAKARDEAAREKAIPAEAAAAGTATAGAAAAGAAAGAETTAAEAKTEETKTAAANAVDAKAGEATAAPTQAAATQAAGTQAAGTQAAATQAVATPAAEAKAADTEAKAAATNAANAEARAQDAEAAAADKAADADAAPASPAAAAEAAEAKTEAAQAETNADHAQAEAEARHEDAQAQAQSSEAPATADAAQANADTGATATPTEAATEEIAATDAETAEAPAADATAEAPATTTRRRRGAHRR